MNIETQNTNITIDSNDLFAIRDKVTGDIALASRALIEDLDPTNFEIAKAKLIISDEK